MGAGRTFGLIFQIFQFVAIAILGLYFLVGGISITLTDYVLIFGVITWLEINALTILLIIFGNGSPKKTVEIKSEKKIKKVEPEDFY